MMHHGYSDYKLLKPDIGIRFVIKWQAMEVHTISTRQISNMFRRAFVHIYSLCCFSLFRLSYQAKVKENPGNIRASLMIPRTILRYSVIKLLF